jgi:hypothetical protein
MKPNSHPFVVIKRTDNIEYTKDEKKHCEVKTIQLFFPSISKKKVCQIVKIVLLIILLLAIVTGKIKETAPIVTYILEQLH